MFLEKVLLGVTLAAPIGPVSIEVIRRGITKGFFAAFLVCVGAVIGDAICLGAAYLGLSSLTKYSYIIDILGLVGALFLLYLGFSNLKDCNQQYNFDTAESNVGIAKSIILGFVLAVVNPVSLIFWVSIFAASTAGVDKITFLPNSLILLGVLIWSLSLCLLLAFAKSLLNNKAIKIIIMLSSILLLGFGCKYGYIAGCNLFIG